MKLGAFSISLAVKDLQASKEFYQHLGFEVFAGQEEKNYLILKNGNALIGIFDFYAKVFFVFFVPNLLQILRFDAAFNQGAIQGDCARADCIGCIPRILEFDGQKGAHFTTKS